jgi:hypothetical protein
MLFELVPIPDVVEFIEREHLIPSTGEIKKVTGGMTIKELREVKKSLKSSSNENTKHGQKVGSDLESSGFMSYNPWVKNVADALQNVTEELNIFYISNKITLELLVQAGKLRIDSQKFLAKVIPKYNSLHAERIIKMAMKLLNRGINFDFVSQACNSVYGILSVDYFSRIDSDEIIDELTAVADSIENCSGIESFFTDKFNAQSEAFREEFDKYYKESSTTKKSIKSQIDANKLFGSTAKKQYQNYMKILHPDNAKKLGLEGTEYLFQFIKEAYELLN